MIHYAGSLRPAACVRSSVNVPGRVWFVSGRLVRSWSGRGRVVVGPWSGRGRVLVGSWSGPGRVVVGSWSGAGRVVVGSGRVVVGSWSGRGRVVVGSWPGPGRVDIARFLALSFRATFIKPTSVENQGFSGVLSQIQAELYPIAQFRW